MQTVQAYPWQIQHGHNTAPGRGGSVCKRIRRTAKRFVVAWCIRRKRWSKGWELKTRQHGYRHAGIRRDLSGLGYRGAPVSK